MPDQTTPVRRTVRGIAAAVLSLGLAAGLAACGGGSDSVNTQSGFVSGDGGVTILSPDKRPAAPVVSGPVLGGQGATLSTKASAGKVLVLNVWGSWCAPCRAEAPGLVAAAARTTDRADFIGLNTRDLDPHPAEAFERGFGVKYPSIYDPAGKLLLEFSDQLPPSGIPSTLVIDAQGRVAARIIGATTETTLVGVIDDVIAGK
ncbi:Thiol-disulfide isomerase or thioredoxin [Raineyella antarctica]|uniref:Thiol-disulfide isomerase or thioredoxin n=1 Tax=Raineyella antarctica TaxID=1577474 RepID=A0A1G6GDZ9_9ACTN|nr:TlpA disulfide reductase family protein [Raineyella antarctica]SDB80242.1 Thiol-disulfide isomerase or thioredoxin [Raineyella antarctica]